MPTLTDILSAPRDMLTVSRVFGEPIDRGEVTIIPVADVRGGGGGGTGPADESGESEGAQTGVPTGAGGGFGVRARPVGVYVIRGESVEWQPTMDITRVSIAGMFLAAIFALALRSVLLRH